MPENLASHQKGQGELVGILIKRVNDLENHIRTVNGCLRGLVIAVGMSKITDSVRNDVLNVTAELADILPKPEDMLEAAR
ncbi:MAG: hypothetical protein QM500_04080 [Methylococcales bacterium]